MKEKPVIFSTPMIRALLNTKPDTWPAEPIDPDRPYKWMARMAVARIDDVGPITEFGESDTPGYKWHFRDKRLKWHDAESVMPYYKTGSTLWVQETFTKTKDGGYIYRADPIFDGMDKGDFSWTWTSPLFLPRKASRILLEVKNVRVERVKEISYEDMAAEGVNFEDNDDFNMAEHYQIGGSPIQGGSPERFAYASLWDGLNARHGYPWDSNPWVWVYEFMRIPQGRGDTV